MLKKLGLGLVAYALFVTYPASAADTVRGGDDNRLPAPGDHSPEPDCNKFFRIDCRYHNVERNPGVTFCYASAAYRFKDGRPEDVEFGVGCDNQSIFNDRGRVQMETTLDRFSPFRSATPAVEVFPQGQLGIEGTYTSELDIFLGRFVGLCYVHKMEEPRPDRDCDHDHDHDRDHEPLPPVKK